MRIKNGLVFSENDKMEQRDLCFEYGVITEESTGGELDATRCYVLPGFIDTHIHGAFGLHFATMKNPFAPTLDLLSKKGVTALLPTISTRDIPKTMEAIRHVSAQRDDRILGIHLEGPFLNKAHKGGMQEQFIIAPDADILKEMQEESGHTVRLITVAAEADGATGLAKECEKLGIAVSMGHSDATYEQARFAVDNGFSRLTHTFNAMRPLNHREPGVLGLALTDDRVNCELICDFVHVSAPMVGLVIKAKGYKNVTMISDAEIACGLSDGEYTLEGGRALVIKDGTCKLKGTDTIAGSCMCVGDTVKNLFKTGVPPEQIAVMASTNPAKVCGCSNRGRLEAGYRADVVILDKDFNVVKVFVNGNEA